MITQKRFELIIQLLKEKEFLTLQEIIDLTGCSASTIRRDLSKLQKMGKLQRVHGGATLKTTALSEPKMSEKKERNLQEKREIAKIAAAQIEDHDCIYIDAGTSTYEMIEHITAQEIVAVTNGLTHVEALLQRGIKTLIIGGDVKASTLASVGPRAIETLKHYHFDKVFIGMNGMNAEGKLTTPDEQEAYVKETAMKVGHQIFVLLDSSKFGPTYFACVNVPKDIPFEILTSTKALKRSDMKTYRNHYSIRGV
ncbi:DeoR/GlpR family DNA-binding transcription regulator [Staphylococcus simulans]|uniref:DeoR/GlpR family DNA-binding transcription regulator n=1 Tax=Staphylococcus simulans TaxID=1286 RepID=UPI000E682776|nr:DeoR/GlpR family DNA-binding transcription regulator [Staphylococcus simulans]RIN76671.1 DeoR/GlpR transcriptional regulator [Staphylococcus simulans]